MEGGKKTALVVGTGTIGEPLISLLAHMKESIGLDEVIFHKRTPLLTDRSKVMSLLDMGAKMAAEPEFMDGFKELGIKAELTGEEAIKRADVVIDCTPAGNRNKEERYIKLDDGRKVFVAQGSEFGFGKMYARGVNDSALVHGEDRFLQVVSCNTHNISVLIHTLGMDNGNSPEDFAEGRFVCMRRANDISQDKKFIAAPQAGTHADAEFGTHHARDAHRLFETMGMDLDLFSSAVKLNTQYMHTIWFQLRVRKQTTLEKIKASIEANRRVAITHKVSANSVFSFGRDHGHYGRILSQTVIPVASLMLRRGSEITGFCYTPQDGNSLLSSLAATAWTIDPEGYNENMNCVRPFMFQEV